ncbi:MAG: anthranilate phosphoribosyltransferase [Thermoleophilaceae bacterium]|jgi:anthranilate phosphoribosyltransferase|nr:anthranilate phosphoribosyltransferase [Thermoleophilaceae bacterium]
MSSQSNGDVLVALVNREPAMSEAMWRTFWARVRERDLRAGEAAALVASLSTCPPDAASLRAMLATLREQHEHPARPLPGTVNVVGTGGGPRTFNLSTAAAFVAATIGARVVKTGSRAYRSSRGSIDLLETLGVPLTSSYDDTEAMVDAHGIACAGGFVYPKELRLLARSVLPLDIRSLGRFFNAFGPWLAVIPVAAQVTGVSDPALLERFRQLARDESDRRVIVCWNAHGVDELLSFEENVLYDGSRDRETRVRPDSLGLAAGTLDDLRPVADDAVVEHFLDLLCGRGAQAAIDSIALNAAALAVACGAAPDLAHALSAAHDSLRQGRPRQLLERVRTAQRQGRAVVG